MEVSVCSVSVRFTNRYNNLLMFTPSIFTLMRLLITLCYTYVLLPLWSLVIVRRKLHRWIFVGPRTISFHTRLKIFRVCPASESRPTRFLYLSFICISHCFMFLFIILILTTQASFYSVVMFKQILAMFYGSRIIRAIPSHLINHYHFAIWISVVSDPIPSPILDHGWTIYIT